MGRKWKKRFSKLSDEDINAKIAEFLEKKEYKSEDEAYDYKKYMKTKAWAKLRNAFLDKHGNRCEICTSTAKNQAHHNSYRRLGNEKEVDLVSICWDCHHEFHKKVKSKSLRRMGECSMCRRNDIEYEVFADHRTLKLCKRCHKVLKDKISYTKCLTIIHNTWLRGGRANTVDLRPGIHKYYS